MGRLPGRQMSQEDPVGRDTSIRATELRLARFPCRPRTLRSPHGSTGQRILRLTTVESREAAARGNCASWPMDGSARPSTSRSARTSLQTFEARSPITTARGITQPPCYETDSRNSMWTGCSSPRTRRIRLRRYGLRP